MKEKMKEFMEKHKTKIIVIGTGAAALTCGVIGYKLGERKFTVLKNSFRDETFMKTLRYVINNSKNYYVRTFGSENIVKFKGLKDLATEAIEFGASSEHLEDNIVGIFVMTRPEG